MLPWRAMASEVPATAEGELGRTPFPHLLVYAVERKLTGALFLTEPTGATHVVRFAGGMPVKVRPGDGFALLGQLLVEAGLLTEELLAGALSAKGLLGDVLVLAGKVESATLEAILEKQFRLRMVHLFDLPPGTSYRYYDGHCELIDWGGDPASIDPLTLLWAGVREHGPSSAAFEEAVSRVLETALAVHPEAPLDRFGFSEEERAVVDVLADKPAKLADLETWDLVTPEMLRRIVYLLLITRCIDLGTSTSPVGAETKPPSGGVATVARVQLRTAVHRLGAAAPDLPGDGERAPRSPLRRRRSGATPAVLDGDGEPPPSQPRLVDGSPDANDTTGDDAPASGVTTVYEPRGAVDRDEGGRAEAPAASTGAGNSTVDRQADTLPPPPPPEAPAATAPAAPPRSAAEELARARDLVAQRRFDLASEACAAARAQDPASADAIDLHVWTRAQLHGADVKVLELELDDLLRVDDKHISARYHRALLRKRLSDAAGAARDLTRVLELAPGHADAQRELAVLAARAEPQKHEGGAGLFGRLFKR